MKKEINIFLTSIMFYTRIPLFGKVKHSAEDLNKATRYFPLIGAIVGGVAVGVFLSGMFVFPLMISILLSMISTVFITGAFHEDGFADFCDGFGGGYTKEKILTIMKDSRIGTYGAIGLLFMLFLKFLVLVHIQSVYIPSILISGHVLSRFFPVLLIYTAPYSREDATSKIKPIGKRGSVYTFIFALLVGLAPLFLLPMQSMLFFLPAMVLIFFIFRRYVLKKIDGYTGDVLGALQQISEVTFYAIFLVFQNLG